MVDFASMEVGEKVILGRGNWDNDFRSIYDEANTFAAAQTPRWQFQFNRLEQGNRSTNPSTGDLYEIERLK